jgi:hypothetical protein
MDRARGARKDPPRVRQGENDEDSMAAVGKNQVGFQEGKKSMDRAALREKDALVA